MKVLSLITAASLASAVPFSVSKRANETTCPQSVCAVLGWEMHLPGHDAELYFNSSDPKYLADNLCASHCASDDQCATFAIGVSSCRHYKKPIDEAMLRLVDGRSGPLAFYDKKCQGCPKLDPASLTPSDNKVSPASFGTGVPLTPSGTAVSNTPSGTGASHTPSGTGAPTTSSGTGIPHAAYATGNPHGPYSNGTSHGPYLNGTGYATQPSSTSKPSSEGYAVLTPSPSQSSASSTCSTKSAIETPIPHPHGPDHQPYGSDPEPYGPEPTSYEGNPSPNGGDNQPGYSTHSGSESHDHSHHGDNGNGNGNGYQNGVPPLGQSTKCAQTPVTVTTTTTMTYTATAGSHTPSAVVSVPSYETSPAAVPSASVPGYSSPPAAGVSTSCTKTKTKTSAAATTTAKVTVPASVVPPYPTGYTNGTATTSCLSGSGVASSSAPVLLPSGYAAQY